MEIKNKDIQFGYNLSLCFKDCDKGKACLLRKIGDACCISNNSKACRMDITGLYLGECLVRKFSEKLIYTPFQDELRYFEKTSGQRGQRNFLYVLLYGLGTLYSAANKEIPWMDKKFIIAAGKELIDMPDGKLIKQISSCNPNWFAIFSHFAEKNGIVKHGPAWKIMIIILTVFLRGADLPKPEEAVKLAEEYLSYIRRSNKG